jgi:hypothetical protein
MSSSSDDDDASAPDSQPSPSAPLPPLRARVLVRDCDPDLLRAVVADMARPPASAELLALLRERMPDHNPGTDKPPTLESMDDDAEVPPLVFTVPLQATYYCGMVQRNVWENVPLTVDAYEDGGSSLTFSFPLQRGWQVDDHMHGDGPVRWPGDSEWTTPAEEQLFLSLCMTLSPARVTLVCGCDDWVGVLSTWDAAFMGVDSIDAAAALNLSAEREREGMLQCPRAPWAYLVQHFSADAYNAARLARAATQPFGERSFYDDEDDEDALGDDAGACDQYNYYHNYYDEFGFTDAGNYARPWYERARYAAWQRLCWLLRHEYNTLEAINDDDVGDRAACRELLRGPVRVDAADALPAWEFDHTLTAEARNTTLLQLRALGLRSGRAAPLEFFRFLGASRPLADVAARRVQLHHAARVIQRAWHRASGCPEYAMGRARVAAMMAAEEEEDA